MKVSYSVVWVSPEFPDVVEDVYGDGYMTREAAETTVNYIDGREWGDTEDWYPRILKITEEFV